MNGAVASMNSALVAVKEADSVSIAHVVFWGGGAVDATIELPGWPNGVATLVATGGSVTIREARAHLLLTPGHHVLLMRRTSSGRPARASANREE